jgi:hypothetical protein
MGKYFGRHDGQFHNRDIYTSNYKKPISNKTTKRPGHLSTLKVRAVCEGCNNGWMSQLEDAAKPILERMLRRERFILNEHNQTTLARWITVKTVVGEYAEEGLAVTPETDRHRIRIEGKIPDYYSIYLGHYAEDKENAWMRTSMTIAASKDGPSPSLNGLYGNTQSVAFLCGSVFLYVLAIRADGLDVNEFIKFSKLNKIFPAGSPIVEWPPENSVTKRDMGVVAYTLNELKRQPNVHDGGDLR